MNKVCETGRDGTGRDGSENTRKSNHLQMSLQRQHFLLSYFKTLSVGPAGIQWPGFELTTSRSADRRSPN